jgi:CheY-like chemotaxis protein
MDLLPPLIFIADDDDDDQLLLRLAFQDHSPRCQLTFSGDGQAFLTQLQQAVRKPSLIVLDLNMPFLNGFETLRSIRADTDYQHIPVIILTTSNDERDRQKAFALGAAGFATKPLKLEDLRQLVKNLCEEWLAGLC